MIADRAPSAGSEVAGALRAVLDRRLVRTLFQPLVHLVDGEVVGFEALSRGPEGSIVEDPVTLLDAAEDVGRLEELDWMCAATASRAARRARLHPSTTIFLNFRPGTLTNPCPDDVAEEIGRARRRLRTVAEIDERDLRQDPAGALEAASRARADGWGVALGNVGATAASLALLPVLHPDVVKLDLHLLAEHRGFDAAEIETTVRSYAEMSGAAVLAQRIETTEDVLSARGFGATYGQGWHYGRPAPLLPKNHAPHLQTGHVPQAPFPLLRRSPAAISATPFEVVSRARESAPTEKRMLSRISAVLEHRALSNGAPAVLLACFQDGRSISSRLRAHYQDLARRMSFTAVFGAHMANLSLPDIRVVPLEPNEPLSREWNVIVVGPNYTGALVARDLEEYGEDRHRRFDHIVTHDRDLVVEAARSLLGWIGRSRGV
ncbi:MAG TPA: EAL domain-containing protein [Acidimicrobiales bacterium]|nr:EAL domain-containing protein [Acidimicrobiales bacterium]